MQTAAHRSDPRYPAITLEDLAARTEELPAMPAAAMAVMRATESEEASAHSVAQALSADQALAARVLRLANSAYYGLPRQVHDVPDAVVVLGLRAVKNLCMVAATYPWLSRPLSGYGMEPMALWRHSFSVGVGAELVARKTDAAQPDVAFTAGLLHDIGKLALSVWLEDKLRPILEVSRRSGLPLEEVERRLLGFDHCEAGAIVGDSWNLPQPLIDAMRFHHRPDEIEPASTLVDCVHVADHLRVNAGLQAGEVRVPHEFNASSFARLGLRVDDAQDLSRDFSSAVQLHGKLLAGAQ